VSAFCADREVMDVFGPGSHGSTFGGNALAAAVGLEALKVPDVFIALLSFIHRYVDVFRTQVRSMRIALDSRAPSMRRADRWRVYGNLAGNLFIRAYDRGERIHQAMLSRGFSGALPSAETLEMRGGDLVLIVVVGLAAAAIVLY
jgi:cobalt/nickel transport system permease protein